MSRLTEMVPLTRRRLLQGAAALSAGLAGCNGASSGTSHSNHPTEAENVETDPDGYALRNPADEPVAWIAESDTEIAPPTPDPDRRIAESETGLIASVDTAARLRFADVAGAADTESLVDTTDFERETLLLETRRIAECYRLELCAVTWSETSYHTYFGRTLRPADVSCRVDAHDRVASLVRIPDVIDPGQVTSHGSGSSSGSCAKYRHRFERELDGESGGGR